MIEFLLSLPLWGGIIVGMLFTTVVGLLVYTITYKLFFRYKSDELKRGVGGLLQVVGILVSLMLSLAFGEVISQLRNIDNAIQGEVVALIDTFRDLHRFDLEGTQGIRMMLIDYAQAVVDDDWPALANDGFGQRGGELKSQL